LKQQDGQAVAIEQVIKVLI